MSDVGKGSSPRPYSVDQKTFSDNWDKIFKKKDRKEIEDAELEDEAFRELFDKQVIMKPEYYDLDNK